MIASNAPVTQFTSKIFELNTEKQRIESQLQDLLKPITTVSLHPAAQERYLSVVENLAAKIRGGAPRAGMGEAVCDLIEPVVVERTKPGEPIGLKVKGRLPPLIGPTLFPESSLSGVSW
jgi:hypothetical protein